MPKRSRSTSRRRTKTRSTSRRTKTRSTSRRTKTRSTSRRRRSSSGRRRGLPPALRKWKNALDRAKKEMGHGPHEMVLVKKGTPLYKLARKYYDASK